MILFWVSFLLILVFLLDSFLLILVPEIENGPLTDGSWYQILQRGLKKDRTIAEVGAWTEPVKTQELKSSESSSTTTIIAVVAVIVVLAVVVSAVVFWEKRQSDEVDGGTCSWRRSVQKDDHGKSCLRLFKV